MANHQTIDDKVTRVPVASIKPSKLAYPEAGDVSALKESIEQRGRLYQAIILNQALELVTGRRRLKACEELGWLEIPALVLDLTPEEAELTHIDDNLNSRSRSALELAELLARREEIYRQLHPDAPSGPGRPKKGATTASFTKAGIEAHSLSQRTIQTYREIARKLTQLERDAIRRLGMANRRCDLLDLAKGTPSERADIIAELVSGSAKDYREAKSRVRDRREEESLSRADSTGSEEDDQSPRVTPFSWWKLGKQILYCGDTGDLLFRLKLPNVRFAFADPPYGAEVAEYDEKFAWEHDWLAGRSE